MKRTENYNRNRGGGTARAAGIPAPPDTPCSNPKFLPFPRLMVKNERGTMTKDEELLRSIIGIFTVSAAGSLPFQTIVKKMRDEHPDLMALLYNSDEHLWAYIRCYTEQFGVDHDPRRPWNVWYLAQTKVVAKADRYRYNRELADGNILLVPDVEMAWKNVRYNLQDETRSVTYLLGLFYQLKRLSNGTKRDFNIRNVASGFSQASTVPVDVLNYVKDAWEFLTQRRQFFNVFGSQVASRDPAYVACIRQLTLYLKEHGGRSQIDTLLEHFQSSDLIGDQGRAAVGLSNQCLYEDFVVFLHQYKLLFRLHTRERYVVLRHDIVPEISDADVIAVPRFTELEMMVSTDEDDPQEQDNGGFNSVASTDSAYVNAPSEDDLDLLEDELEFCDDDSPYELPDTGHHESHQNHNQANEGAFNVGQVTNGEQETNTPPTVSATSRRVPEIGDNLSSIVVALCNKDPDFVAGINDLKALLETVLRRQWEGMQVVMYGSQRSFLPTAESDADFGLRFMDRMWSKREIVNRLFDVEHKLKSDEEARRRFYRMEVIFKTRVPIVKFWDIETGLNVDMSIFSDSGPLLTELLRWLRIKSPVFQFLGVAVKHLVSRNGCYGAKNGYPNGAALMLMVAEFVIAEEIIGEIDVKKFRLKSPASTATASSFTASARPSSSGTGEPRTWRAVTGEQGEETVEEEEDQEQEKEERKKEVANIDGLLVKFFHTYGNMNDWGKYVVDVVQCSNQKASLPRFSGYPMVVRHPFDRRENLTRKVLDGGRFLTFVTLLKDLGRLLEACPPGIVVPESLFRNRPSSSFRLKHRLRVCEQTGDPLAYQLREEIRKKRGNERKKRVAKKKSEKESEKDRA